MVCGKQADIVNVGILANFSPPLFRNFNGFQPIIGIYLNIYIHINNIEHCILYIIHCTLPIGNINNNKPREREINFRFRRTSAYKIVKISNFWLTPSRTMRLMR